MNIYLKTYMFLWISATLISLLLLVKNRSTWSLTSLTYWNFLFEPWKLVTFLGALLMIALAAPFSGDHTWDMTDSIIISVLTYGLAPWSVAVLFRSLKDKIFGQEIFAAFCIFWVPCWTYDLYILLRDGLYPPTWSSNLVLSGGINVCAGLFWNLYWSEKTGLTFAFMLQHWPPAEKTPFRKVFWLCCVTGIPVFFSIAWFVYMYLKK
jgi:hypothetical protein